MTTVSTDSPGVVFSSSRASRLDWASAKAEPRVPIFSFTRGLYRFLRLSARSGERQSHASQHVVEIPLRVFAQTRPLTFLDQRQPNPAQRSLRIGVVLEIMPRTGRGDRKSTRLNSSHT